MAIELGLLIRQLELCEKPEAVVYFDFCDTKPDGTIDSYRGYYDHLAIGWRVPDYKDKDVTVADLLVVCKGAIDKTFQGYKGGDFRMDESTPVWVANNGSSGGTFITHVQDERWRVVLRTDLD